MINALKTKVGSVSRRTLALVLALAVVLTTLSTALIFASANEIDVWDGQTETAPTVGDGSSGTPYEISKPEHLAYVLANPNAANVKSKRFKLTNDIYLNNVTGDNWANKIGLNEWYGDTWFKGHLDGNGHIVYGIWYSDDNTYKFAGLIPELNAGSVKNIGVRKAKIVAGNGDKVGVGGIVGYSKSGSAEISQCFVDDTVSVHHSNSYGSYGAGGILGFAETNKTNDINPTPVRITINNCYSWASVTGNGSKVQFYNGIIGQHYKSCTIVKNSYSYGTAPYYMATANAMTYAVSKDSAAPATKSVLTNVYSNVAATVTTSTEVYTDNHTVITTDGAMLGDNAKTSMSGLDYTTVFETVKGNPPKLQIFPDDIIVQPETNQDGVWKGGVECPTEVNGAGELLISKPEHLAYIIKNQNDSAVRGKKFKLTTDIYLNDVTKKNWDVPALGYAPNEWYCYTDLDKEFVGDIDGDGHMIYGIWYPEGNTEDEVALIPRFRKGKISNLGISRSVIRGKAKVGGFVASLNNSAGLKELDKCFVDSSVTITATDKSSGGIIAFGDSIRTNETSKDIIVSVTNCYSKAIITAQGNRHNAIFGDIWKCAVVIKNCYSVGAAPYQFTAALGRGTTLINAGLAATEVLNNNYSDTGTPSEFDYYSVPDAADMLGENAKTSMSGLDFVNTYETVAGKTPKLQVFPDDYLSDFAAAGGVWDGETTTAPTVGTGEDGSPFEISSPEHLAYVIKNGGGEGKFYKLTADIYLNDVKEENWYDGEGLNKWYTQATAPKFNGTIDGDGHVIYGLYNVETGSKVTNENTYRGNGCALIPRMQVNNVVVIKNLGIDNAYIDVKNVAGAFVACCEKGDLTIENSYAGDGVTVCGIQSGVFAGFMTGKFTIKNCFSHAVTKQGDVGNSGSYYGLLGQVFKSSGGVGMDGSSIENCYNATGSVTSQSKISAEVTYTNVYVITSFNATGVTLLTQKRMQGQDAITNPKKMPGLFQGTTAFYVTDSYPLLKAFTDETIVDPGPYTGPSAAEDTGKVWNGSIIENASGFSDGDGSAGDPYIIERGSQLKFALETKNANLHYKLAKDIYLNDTDAKAWYENEENNEWINDSDKAFAGHLDGDGHIVHGIWYMKDNAYGAGGLVPKFAGGSIKNIGVRYSYISVKKYAGGIVGYGAKASKIFDKCFVDESVTINSSAEFAGGIIGFITGDDRSNVPTEARTQITNCYSKANISSKRGHYGLIGFTKKSAYSVKNSYSVNYVPYYAREGTYLPSNFWNDYTVAYTEGAEGLVDISEVFNNVYTDVKYKDTEPSAAENYVVLDHKDMMGDKAKTSMSGLDFENTFAVVAEGTPKLKIFTQITGKDEDLSLDGLTYAGGNGKKDNPYVIATADQLRYLVQSKDTAGKYYILANDIKVNNTDDPNWINNNPAKWYEVTKQTVVFQGDFDGRGHFVYGLFNNTAPSTSTTEQEISCALFPVVYNTTGSIRNVHVRNSYISSKGYGGAIVGRVYKPDAISRVKIIGCSADSTVTVKGQYAGGIAGGGNMGINMQYCYFTGKLQAGYSKYTGALVGNMWSAKQEVGQCYTVGYKNYGSSIPAAVLGLYGTVEQKSTKFIDDEKKLIGAGAKDVLPRFNWDIWYTVDGSTPHLRVIEEEDILDFNAEGVKGKVWSGLTATKFADGDGTENKPYIIETPEQLAYMISQTGSSEGKYYKITADIKLNDTSKSNWTDDALEWVSSGSDWSGKIDGDGHVISGLYFNTVDSRCGLISKAKTGTEIKKLGITKSHIVNREVDSKEVYAAAFIGQTIGNNNTDDKETYVNLKMSECFADDSVYVESKYAGGLVAGNPRALTLTNCYFSGELYGYSNAGTLIANTWNSYVSEIINCYSVSLDRDPFMENSGAANALVTDSYIDGSKGKVKGVTSVGIVYMRGENAKTSMPGLDFENVWKTVEGGSPVLRCFADPEQYSSHREPFMLEMTFASEGGSECEPVYGFAGQPIDYKTFLPTPTRPGYRFDGWYTNKYKVIPYTFNFFPDYDIVLYAKWTKTGFEQGFEGLLDETYDYNSAITQIKPGDVGYTPKNIQSGMKSIKAISGTDVTPTFLLAYEDVLIPGTEYELTFWIAGGANNSSGVIEFLAAADPHIYSKYTELTRFEYSNLKAQEWKEFKIKFVAKTPYVVVKVNSDTDLYLDSFLVDPTGKTEAVGDLVFKTPDGLIIQDTVDMNRPIFVPDSQAPADEYVEQQEQQTQMMQVVKRRRRKKKKVNTDTEESANLLIPIIIAASAIVVAGGVTGGILFAKKRKKKD